MCFIISIYVYLEEKESFSKSYVSGFWLFIFREAAVFGSLLFCCLYFDNEYYTNISSSLELPFLGCFILLGSSLTVTSYHHLVYWKFSWLPLGVTILLGCFFVYLQMLEMEEVVMNIYDNSFYARRFCTVGLHFSHVVLGILGLITVLLVGCCSLGYYRCSLVVWYWHFVDYVWLLVYTVVYIC